MIPADEIEYSGYGSMSGGRSTASQSRAQSLTGYRCVLKHRPTGVVVEGEVQPGHYSKKVMQRLKQELYDRLLGQLEGLIRKRRDNFKKSS